MADRTRSSRAHRLVSSRPFNCLVANSSICTSLATTGPKKSTDVFFQAQSKTRKGNSQKRQLVQENIAGLMIKMKCVKCDAPRRDDKFLVVQARYRRTGMVATFMKSIWGWISRFPSGVQKSQRGKRHLRPLSGAGKPDDPSRIHISMGE